MVIALDVGTSSTRASVWDDTGRPIEGRSHQIAYRTRVSADGGAELSASTLLDAVATCLDAVLAGRPAVDVEAVGVTTFWHGLLGFDATGAPLTPTYLWADTRATEDARLLRSALDEEALRRRTGCHVHPSYWPAKLRWFARANAVDLARIARWGSIGEHLEQTFFGNAVTSISIASGTGLFDQERLRWDVEALAAAGITEAQLFPLADRSTARRRLRPAWSLRWPALRGAAWFPAVGDGAASSIGSGCVGPGRIALNVGTSAALRVVRRAPPVPPRGLWRYRLDRDLGVVGGATSEGGNVRAWCAETLRLPPDDEVERALAAGDPATHGLTALPFFAGERSPGWRGDRRAAIAGLGLDTTPLDVLRAILEAVVLRLALVYDLVATCADPGHVIVGSGGAVERSPAWLRMIADAIGRPITRSREPEATSRGIALLTLHALGALRDLEVPAPLGETIEPDPARHARYQDALSRQQALDERL